MRSINNSSKQLSKSFIMLMDEHDINMYQHGGLDSCTRVPTWWTCINMYRTCLGLTNSLPTCSSEHVGKESNPPNVEPSQPFEPNENFVVLFRKCL